MSETRKIAAILVADVVGYSRLAGADEDRTLSRLRALRSDLIDPTISVHHGRRAEGHRVGARIASWQASRARSVLSVRGMAAAPRGSEPSTSVGREIGPGIRFHPFG